MLSENPYTDIIPKDEDNEPPSLEDKMRLQVLKDLGEFAEKFQKRHVSQENRKEGTPEAPKQYIIEAANPKRQDYNV